MTFKNLLTIGLPACLLLGNTPAMARDLDKLLPAPLQDEAATTEPSQSIIVAGGCFWGVQGVFEHVKGVMDATSGYAGGAADTAQYETVSTGTTHHAESVKVTYDPKVISLGQILRIYFSVVADPTELNRQGPDSGTQYRSEIFASNPDQARIASSYIQQLDATKAFSAPIQTTVGQDTGFYPAEMHHQNFLPMHPNHPYITMFDMPKVAALQSVFPDSYQADPVLTQAGS